MNEQFSDKSTRNLLNGINLILSKHPEGKVRIGYSQDVYVKTDFINQEIRTEENTLSKTEEQLLEEWGWNTENRYNNDYYWNYEMIGVDS